MRKINGHYTDQFVKQHAYSAEIPESWDELNAGQYAMLLQLLTYANADKHTIGASMLSVLFGPKNCHILNNLPDDLLYELMPFTNFVFETAPPPNNRFPKLKLRKKKCFAPADDLSNIGFGEWCFAYQFYTYFIKTGEIEFLNRLIATLYRPTDPEQTPNSPDFKGDIRLPFNENLIESQAKAVADVSERIKTAILGWLRVTFSSIQDSRPNAFPEPEKDVTGNIKEQADDARTWLTVFRELLGPKWGTVDQLKYTNAMFVLDHLEEQQLEFNRNAKPVE